jgi:uncharacterized PurR-regulated membrane protein YhhQ (DUF165 family)
MNRRIPIALAAAAAFVLCIVAANYTTEQYPAVSVVPGGALTATAGTYFAGLTFLVRDTLQDAGGRRLVALLIVIGAGMSYVLSDPALAVASAAAFLTSETADQLVYSPLRERGYLRAMVASNIVGAVVDTAVFLWLAAPFLSRVDPTFTVSGSMGGQIVGKLTVTAVLFLLVGGARALLREPIHAEGA